MGTRVVLRWVASGSFILLAGAWGATASAQGAYGYVFGAPGAVQCCGEARATLHVGGGGEFITPIGLGVGAEIGFLGPWEELGEGIGVFSVNGVYDFLPRRSTRRVSPFATGGYTVFFRDGAEGMWNVGGGVHVRINDRMAVRVELRDHINSGFGETVHFWGARVGLTFGGW